MAKTDLTAERLREVLHYDPSSGIFVWRKTLSKGRGKAGRTAGCLNNEGYITIGIDKINYRAHRLAWLFVTGQWPTGMIDHINGDRSDNRSANLREANCNINSQNRRAPARNSKFSYIGVYRTRHDSGWRSRIRVNGQRIELGIFPTPELAYAAYLEAKRIMHPGCTI